MGSVPSRVIPAFCSLADLSVSTSELLPAIQGEAPNSVSYTNMHDYNPALGEHLLRDIYVDRSSRLDSVLLVRLQSGAVILGGGHFVLRVGDALAKEQYPVYFSRSEAYLDELLRVNRPREEVDAEALLVARYGIFTWGHWLGELLPKVALVEMHFPMRFCYVLPFQVMADKSPTSPWRRIRESLMAYGISANRIISIHPESDYRFSSLYAVTSVWSDFLMHPGALEVMRAIALPVVERDYPARLGIQRDAAYGRCIDNSEQIESFLAGQGFELRNLTVTPFTEQVGLFSRAELIFGVLGSDLTNLIYSPNGVKVISVAPADFGDRFFYALIVARRGKQIDLRGEVTAVDQQFANKSNFVIDVSEIDCAINWFCGSREKSSSGGSQAT